MLDPYLHRHAGPGERQRSVHHVGVARNHLFLPHRPILLPRPNHPRSVYFDNAGRKIPRKFPDFGKAFLYLPGKVAA